MNKFEKIQHKGPTIYLLNCTSRFKNLTSYD